MATGNKNNRVLTFFFQDGTRISKDFIESSISERLEKERLIPISISSSTVSHWYGENVWKSADDESLFVFVVGKPIEEPKVEEKYEEL